MRLDCPVRGQQDGAARRLVHAARLHADEAVLHQVDAADAVVAAELVELGEQRGGRHRLAVEADRVSLGEADRDVCRPVGRVHRRDGALIDVRRRLDCRVLQHFAFRGGVQHVGIDRERRFPALVLGDRDLVRFRERDQLLAALEVPLPPGRDDADRGLERVVGELEAHLIVALAGGAVADGIRAGLPGDVDLGLGDQRPRDRGAEQIDALIQRIGAEHREHIVADELLAQVLDEDVGLLDAKHLRLAAGRLQLLALAEVSGEGHHLRLIGLLQPFEDDGRIEAAGVGEHDLLDLGTGALGRHGTPRFAQVWLRAHYRREFQATPSLTVAVRRTNILQWISPDPSLDPAAHVDEICEPDRATSDACPTSHPPHDRKLPPTDRNITQTN